ncbi:nucleoside triphosphate pyrophosphohydrolase [Mesorhizobium sp. Cs1299R1N3]|uniref:nucleoside triphosphate pyrophosphohydrolase n=1 Tax=Mesorhizobium sp. Cs1299R1N3 TaxID=3015173 RepID=UPI00301BDDFF
MSDQVLVSHDVPLQSWSDAEALTPSFGAKGARLFALPRAWCPPFAVVSAKTVAWLAASGAETSRFFADVLSPIAQRLRVETDEIIVRSSVVGETIWDRGTYKSIVLNVARRDDLDAPLLDAIREVSKSAGDHDCAIILQTHVFPEEAGEFGNLLRVSRTRDHWEYSIRTTDPVIQTERFNSQRDIAPPADKPLRARVGLPRERLFGSVAAWINNELLRGVRTRVNCEWVRRGELFYIVQIDAEDDDLYGVNPMQLHIEPSVSARNDSGQLLIAADVDRRGDWDKLLVLDELYEENSAVAPKLFFLPVPTASKGNLEQLESEFTVLLNKNIVVRTSVAAGQEKVTNLPKTDCMTPKKAADWCVEQAARLAELHPEKSLAFVAHRYIASRSSAWVRADPDSPIVEMHGTWGLPDALQFCPYDIWDVHIPTEEVTEYTNYKSNVLLLQADGTWKYERVKNEVARFQSINRNDVLDVAKRSFDLATRLGKACHIMWFVGCRTDDENSINLPWYWTEAHDTENPDRGNLQIMTIRNTADLSKIAEMKRRYPRLAVLLQPTSVELLRDNGFLFAVAEIVRPMSVPVILSGSTLAHAFFQLRKHGCVVISEVEKDHLRTRRQTNFGKLVRDKIPEKIARQQEQQSVATIPKSARVGFLIGKFLEEILEAREATEMKDRRTELADVFEVLRAFITISDETLENVVGEADKKRNKVGGFDGGKLLLETSLPKAQSGTQSKDAIISSGTLAEPSGPRTYRVPFSYFGFAEIGQLRTLRFAGTNSYIQLSLQRDCIEISLLEEPTQLSLGV